ncbi:PadR family transcriptional regulator [Halomarina litorea]|uniref:PadR family transcriptional regulator n=1 Tax=Halomarina litorea TaxID=2961595 RepID=UPI0020C21BD2|nr:PadR family transcriptional regulator [Halomarina sp. BCD28]
MKWLESGTRRDICALLYRGGELRGQALKTHLERHYDLQLDPKRFYDRMDALVSAGHVEKRADGLHDVYALTEQGERRLLDHHEWLSGCVEAGKGDGDSDDDDGRERRNDSDADE